MNRRIMFLSLVAVRAESLYCPPKNRLNRTNNLTHGA